MAWKANTDLKRKYPTEKEFLTMLPVIRETARSLGYAIGLHGSLKRDFDLMAVPWTDDAVDSDDVAEAIMKVTGCVRWRVHCHQGNAKPHGRKVYCFDWSEENIENRGYIDLSVIPSITNEKPIIKDIAPNVNFIQNKFGYCFYSIDDFDKATIFNLYINLEYRRKGHAKNLLQCVINEIKEINGYETDIYIEAKPRENRLVLKNLLTFIKV